MSHHPKGPPPEEVIRKREAAREQPPGRDITPAVGKRGQPGEWKRAVEGAKVAFHEADFGDARWSFLYDKDTRYAAQDGAAADGAVAAANRRMRGGEEVTVAVQGPFIHAAVWTWQVPLYFWFGGMATGSSFVALACDVAGDKRSARIARMVTVAAILPGSPLLVMVLGRPERFLNMLRIFKPRSPMSLGSWCLSTFSAVSAGAVAADLASEKAVVKLLPARARGAAKLLGRPWLARLLGGKTALLGTYLGSYTGVLLAGTANPVWNRSRMFLPPLFICTAMATGAAANRLVLAALGTPADHPTRRALGTVETAAMVAELVLGEVNERRLGSLREVLEAGAPGKQFNAARTAVLAGLSLRLAGKRGGGVAQHASSACFMAAAMLYRFAWVGAGR
ncbi:MAG TPA: NrfD/PsrC family molybdoenzyme membrane anchor subunit, partial [Solirubrobacteraceae bacterium]